MANATQIETGGVIYSVTDAAARNTLNQNEYDALLHMESRQYIDISKATQGQFYWHNGNGTSENENTWIIPMFRVYAGINYEFKNVYGYFCVIKYDDDTVEAFTEQTNTVTSKSFLPMLKNGYALVTVYNTQINNAVAMAGTSSYNRPYFVGSNLNQDEVDAVNLLLNNKLNTISQSSTISDWASHDYTIDGNKITYNAPASGNSGFYITPSVRNIIDKITVQCNVLSNGSGSMTVHIWDKSTSDFANHLYTIKTINESENIEINLSDVFLARPSMNPNDWVILVSNTGNSFTFVFDSISIYNGSVITNHFNGEPLSKAINSVFDSVGIAVECGAGKTYTRLRDAISEAIKYKNSNVIVYPGTYDLTSEFSSEISAATGSNMGIELSNNVYVKFLSGSYVTALFPNSSVDISEHFQPFWSNGSGFTLDGLHIEASNCRYCVHDERGGADVKYHNVYKNCVMKFTMDDPAQSGGTSKYMQCIGGGLGKYGYIEIDGGNYTTVNNSSPNSQQPISYHNGYSSGCDSKIFIKDVYLADKGIIRLGCYGSSIIKTPVYVCGCSMYAHVYKMIEAPQEYNIDNFEVVEWNNILRNEQVEYGTISTNLTYQKNGNVVSIFANGVSASSAVAWAKLADLPQSASMSRYSAHFRSMDGTEIQISGSVIRYRGNPTSGIWGVFTYVQY